MLTTSFPRFRGDYAGVFIYELARELVRQGIGVRVVAPGDPLSVGREMVDGVEVARFQYMFPKRLQRLAYEHGGITVALKKDWVARFELPFFLVSFVHSAMKWVRGCDLIHAHWAGSGLVGLLPGRILRKPVLLSVRGTDVKLIDDSDIWKLMFDFILQRVDSVTTVSEEHGRRITERGVDGGEVFLVPNGIDADRFRNADRLEAREELGLPLDSKIVLFVGNLIEVKGVDYLTDAIPAIRETVEDALFVMLGEGELRAALRRKIVEYGVSDWVRMVGIRPASEIPLWMNSADVLVLPSLSEGRPNVVLEAMACEVPVVATAVGGIPELVKDGEVGFLIPPKSPESIANKVVLLLKDEKLRERLGRNGRKYIMEEGLTWESCARKFSEIYHSLIERSARR